MLPLRMLFFEYFKSQLNNEIIVNLKNDISISGILKNVDPFLNIKIENVIAISTNEFIKINKSITNIKLCSIRGSAIKSVELKKNGLEEHMVEATRIKCNLDC